MSAEPASRTADGDLTPAIRPAADANRGDPLAVHLAGPACRERAYRVRVYFGVDSYRAQVTGRAFLGPDHAIDHARRVVREQSGPTGRFHRGEVVSA